MNTIATFTCDDEYYIDENESTTCETSGDWSRPTPTCIGNEFKINDKDII